MSSFFDMINASNNINVDDINRTVKLQGITRFAECKMKHPHLSKTELLAMAGISSSKLNRDMKDLGMKSFYKHAVPVNKPKVKKDVVLSVPKQKQSSKIRQIKGGALPGDDDIYNPNLTTEEFVLKLNGRAEGDDSKRS